MLVGGFLLVLIGALVNYRWVIDYAAISQDVFRKYYGMHPTFWGIIDKTFKVHSLSMIIGFGCVVAVFLIEAWMFWRNESDIDVLPAFASLLPVALLISPYSWNYDQILLLVPIVFLLITISAKYGIGKAALFMLGIVALAFAMVIVAYRVGHDVWSFMNSFVVWIFTLYFVTKKNWPLKQEVVTANMG